MRYTFLTPWKNRLKSPLTQTSLAYLKRLRAYTEVTHVEAATSDVCGAPKKVQRFFEQHLKEYTNPRIIALEQQGLCLSTEKFADLLKNYSDQGEKNIIFCVGGAYGLPKNIAEQKKLILLSLSSLTLPHELAFLLLTEQVYRAHTLLAKHPYHHAEASELMNMLSLKT